MNLAEVTVKLKDLNKDKKRGLPLLQHPLTRERLSDSRMRDLGTHTRTITAALGRGTPDRIDATELTEDNALRVKTHLEEMGKNKGVIDSTLGTFDIMAGFAREEGVVILQRPALARPERNPIYHKAIGGPGYYTKIAHAVHVMNNSEYGLRYVDWPECLRCEYEDNIKPFFCDPHIEKRSAKRPASPQYMVTWLNRAERAFGYLRMQGVPLEQLSFRLLADYDTMLGYMKWLYERRGGRHTMTTRGDLEQWRHLAASFYEDHETGKKLTLLIRKRTEFVTVKDKSDLVLRVHADDLFDVFMALVAEAEHYEAHLNRKYGRVKAIALSAHKWMEAGIWGLTIVTWLREGNVAIATPRNLYKLEDGTWYFRFAYDEMKSKRVHSDHVIDFWKGPEAQLLLDRTLDKVVEMRPHLVERFHEANPGKREHEQFFLNMKGRKYSNSALRNFFTSASVRYLGAQKRISFHDVRAIVPSWLFVREGPDILTTVQRRLDHAHIQTTQKFYLKIEKLFDSRLAKARMDERAKRRKDQDRLGKLPDELAAMLIRFKDEIINAQGGAIDPQAVQRMVMQALQGQDASGLSPTLPPPDSKGRHHTAYN